MLVGERCFVTSRWFEMFDFSLFHDLFQLQHVHMRCLGDSTTLLVFCSK